MMITFHFAALITLMTLVGGARLADREVQKQDWDGLRGDSEGMREEAVYEADLVEATGPQTAFADLSTVHDGSDVETASFAQMVDQGKKYPVTDMTFKLIRRADVDRIIPHLQRRLALNFEGRLNSTTRQKSQVKALQEAFNKVKFTDAYCQSQGILQEGRVDLTLGEQNSASGMVTWVGSLFGWDVQAPYFVAGLDRDESVVSFALRTDTVGTPEDAGKSQCLGTHLLYGKGHKVLVVELYQPGQLWRTDNKQYTPHPYEIYEEGAYAPTMQMVPWAFG
jgi:hypothetical protein